MNPQKSRDELRKELVEYKTREASERMELLRLGEGGGGMPWPECTEHLDLDQAAMLYELELDFERR